MTKYMNIVEARDMWERVPLMSKARFNIGDVLRYGNGNTALMRVTSIKDIGQHVRYYGEQYFGGSEGAYEYYCNPANEAERALWARRWVCNTEGCEGRPGLAGSGVCPQCARAEVSGGAHPRAPRPSFTFAGSTTDGSDGTCLAGLEVE